MSEVQSRPSAPRGRSSARGGRGGYGSRGGPRTGSRPTNGDHKDAPTQTEDQGELGELKKKYGSELGMLKELFPDWTDVDLVLAMEESNGDLQTAVDKITEGNVSQFSEIKKKDRSRSKVTKDAPTASTEAPSTSTRGGRGRGGFEGRGGRGRATDRGRGSARGGRGGALAANGSRGGAPASQDSSVPTTDSAWDIAPSTDSADKAAEQPSSTANKENNVPEGQWGSVVTAESTPATASEGMKASLVPEPAKKTWASMFAPKPKVAPALPKPAPAPAPKIQEPEATITPAEINVAHEETPQSVEEPEVPTAIEEPPETEPTEAIETSVATPPPTSDTSAVEITPPKDQLTEENVEHLPDTSNPAPTETAASTVASVRDPRSLAGTPLTGMQQQQPPIGQPPIGGYQASALKAAGVGGRSASFTRKILEQQEAVVMPGNHGIDKAAVQFGSMGLNGDADSDALDIDDDREEPETRTQPPQQSPPSQPRAALPPVQRQAGMPADMPSQEPVSSAPKPAPGLPPVPQQQQQSLQQQSPHVPIAPQAMTQAAQARDQYGPYGRYGQSQMPQSESAVPSQKPYDPFSHQLSQPGQYDYPGQSQGQGQQQQGSHSQLGGFSSGNNDYSSFYTSDQQRNAYQSYYNGGFGHQGAPGQQEAGASQQRAGSGLGNVPGESAYGSSQSQQTQSRFGEAQNSGHNTPNPLAGQQGGAQSQSQSQHLHQQPHSSQSGHGGGYNPYNSHPYFNQPYYGAYVSQYGYGQGGYGPFGGKGGMYGQPHHGYGMSPQSSYEHSSSPANVSGFGQQSSLHGRDSGLSSGLGEYGRTGSSAPSQSQQSSSGAYDPFSRSQSGFPGQYGQQQAGSQTSADESLKPSSDSKSGFGPSPSLGQPGRPGSAANNQSSSGQSGLPPPASHQQGYGGFPGPLGGQGSQYGGLGGLGGHQGAGQGHQPYGYGGFGNSYGSYNSRGWSGNYGH